MALTPLSAPLGGGDTPLWPYKRPIRALQNVLFAIYVLNPDALASLERCSLLFLRQGAEGRDDGSDGRRRLRFCAEFTDKASSLISQVPDSTVLSPSMPPRSPEHAALGEAVSELRERQGLTQEQLAGVSGMQATYLSDIERGVRNPAWSSIVSLSKALKVKPSELASLAERS